MFRNPWGRRAALAVAGFAAALIGGGAAALADTTRQACARLERSCPQICSGGVVKPEFVFGTWVVANHSNAIHNGARLVAGEDLKFVYTWRGQKMSGDWFVGHDSKLDMALYFDGGFMMREQDKRHYIKSCSRNRIAITQLASNPFLGDIWVTWDYVRQ